MTRCWGIKSKNAEQEEAINALTNPEIDLVILSGIAGSGKTLLALAAGLEQVLETKMYNDIVFTRAPVPVGDDMGHLPGTIEEKLYPWCGALLDNLEMLVGSDKLTETILKTKIKMLAIMHMRGRSFHRRYIILDEAQNLSTAQLKVILTRAGEDTKFIIMGDESQVDNRKLTSSNNALVNLIEAAKNTDFIKHIALPTGVRSRLCTWTAENL